jgi:hypothetical protein
LGKALAKAALDYLASVDSAYSAIEATHASAMAAVSKELVVAIARSRQRGARPATRERRPALAGTKSLGCAAFLGAKASEEADAWKGHSRLALAAFGFWEKFFGLGVKTGVGEPPPTRERTSAPV